MKNKKLKSLLAIIVIFMTIITSMSAYAAEPVKSSESLTAYKMDVTFDELGKTLSVSETVSFTNPYDTELKDLVFHLYPDSYGNVQTMPAFGPKMGDKELPPEALGDIDVDKVSIGNKDISFTEDNQILKLKLDTPLKKGENIEIKITFKLKIPMGTGRLGYQFDVYSLTNWYPLMSIYDVKNQKWDENPFHPVGESNYSDASNYDITINTPKNIVTAATGVTTSESEKDGIKTLNIKAEKVRDFVFMMSKNYRVVSKEVNGIKVNSYYIASDNTKESTESTAKRLLDVVADSVAFFSETFGKYPYPELDVVETYLAGGAMEYPQLIQMGKYFPQQPQMGMGAPWVEEAAVHETGHQWWYVSVGNNEFMEPFLDESITVYSTALYYEKRDGKYSQNGVLMKIRNRVYISPTDSTSFNSSVDKYKDFGDYVTTIYNKAPAVLEALRMQVGEENFLKIMKTYFSKYLYKNASIEDFLNVIESISGSSVKEKISAALSAKDYSPREIQLTEDERRIMSREMYKASLMTRESQFGTTIGSFILRLLKGENAIIVKPSNLPAEVNQSIDAMINDIKSGLEDEYSVKITVKDDKSITEYEKKNSNLMLFGN
jgi:hypothetical protein